MASKDIKQLLDRARRLGCTVRPGGSGHWRVTGPRGTITVAGSPRSRALHKVKADLRRIGARL